MNIELWQIITLGLGVLGFAAGGGKLLLNQILHHFEERFESHESVELANHTQLYKRLDAQESSAREATAQWQRMERELLTFKADLPLHYVRREDYIRGQTVMEAKQDALYSRIELLQNHIQTLINKGSQNHG